MQLTQSFTMSESLSKGWSLDYSVTVPVNVPPQTTVAAYWITSRFTLWRTDGTMVGNPVTAQLDNTIYYSQFPAPKPDPPA